MDFLFKIWTANREQKTFVMVEGDNDLYERVVLKASEKLKVDGSALVLEGDGTLVDEDQVLKMLHKETFILLSKNESWKPSNDSSVSSRETLVLSRSSSPEPSPFNLSERSIENLNSPSTVVSPMFWDDFPLPFSQLNKSVIENCEQGRRNNDSINKVVTVTIDAVREVKKYVSTSVLKRIARRIIQKYPKQFTDIDEDGVVIGEGTHSLTSKLIDRNNYLNRPHKRPPNSVHLDVPPSKRKSMLSAKAGCSNWQPETSSCEPETRIEKQRALNDDTKSFVFNDKTENLLRETYAHQRLFLNSGPPIEEISAEWPVLLLKDPAFWHFKMLVSQDISILEQRFMERVNKILQLGINGKFSNVDAIPDDEEEKHRTCLKVIGDFFKENVDLLIKDVDELGEVPEIKAPCIRVTRIVEKENLSTKYHIYAEKTEIPSLQCERFLEALMVVFALYYNFNMSYPKGISHVLEFLQRYMIKVNPEQGSKSKKKSISKIVSLMNKLREC